MQRTERRVLTIRREEQRLWLLLHVRVGRVAHEANYEHVECLRAAIGRHGLADCVAAEVEFSRELLVHDGNLRRAGDVARRELATRQQRHA